MRANVSELKLGVEASVSTPTIGWDDTIETAYVNLSVNGWFLAAAYYFFTTGQPVPSPIYAQ